MGCCAAARLQNALTDVSKMKVIICRKNRGLRCFRILLGTSSERDTDLVRVSGFLSVFGCDEIFYTEDKICQEK